MNKNLRLFLAFLIAGSLIVAGISQKAYEKAFQLGYTKGLTQGVSSGQSNAANYSSAPVKDAKPVSANLDAFTVDNFIIKINQARQAVDLQPLQADAFLTKEAAQDIDSSCGKITQKGFKLQQAPDKLKEYRAWGEILSEDTKTPKNTVDEWLHNAEQQGTLLKPGFVSLGVAVKDSKCIAAVFALK